MIAETILDRIVRAKKEEIARAKASVPLQGLKDQIRAGHAPPARDFAEALRGAPPIRLIAEVKRASPSAGVIRQDFDPVSIALQYQEAGASCLSVLTDEQHFQGQLAFLTAVRQAVDLPVLRKDFVLDPYQLYESRAAGADAVLLIAECLRADQLKQLHQLAGELGMTPLVELYDPRNLDKVLGCGARLVGVNNRDLQSFAVDLTRTLQIRERLPRDRLVVAESGIRTRQEVLQLQDAAVDAMLVGESLMRQRDIAAATRVLLGG